MGLDMYLNRKTYIGNKYRDANKRVKIVIPEDQTCVVFPTPPFIKLERITEITEELGYWRKANHIHNWFVENVQHGKDDCGEYYVTKDDLLKLLSECKKVTQEEMINAPAILPTKGGFFFGSTDYDEYYFKTIEYTITLIESILQEGEGQDIYYSSSW